MAKRRKLELPKAEDLDRLEEEFRSETSPQKRPTGLTPPIAQVAADAATLAPVLDTAQRAEQAKNATRAAAFQEALDKGLVLREIPVNAIDPDDMMRDRANISQEDMLELRLSIAANGLRLPIEVYEMAKNDDGVTFGLISGYRRLLAVKELFALTNDAKYHTIKAIVKTPSTSAEAIAAMVEENEIRADISHFERGRVAALSAQNGVFSSLEEAVNRLFASASKAKRSKIRSFANVFEELGDMLRHPETLTERQGLRLANALRNGAGDQLREILDQSQIYDQTTDWEILEPVLNELEEGLKPDPVRGGRPKSNTLPPAFQKHLSSGISISREKDSKGYVIRLSGAKVDAPLVDHLIDEISYLLEEIKKK